MLRRKYYISLFTKIALVSGDHLCSESIRVLGGHFVIEIRGDHSFDIASYVGSDLLCSERDVRRSLLDVVGLLRDDRLCGGSVIF